MALILDRLEKWYTQTVKMKCAFSGETPPSPIPLPDVTNVDGFLEGIVGETEEAFVALAKSKGIYHDYEEAYTIELPANFYRWYGMEKIGGRTIVWNQLVDSGTTTVPTISGHKYYALIDGTESIITSSGSAIAVVNDTSDMVCDLTLMFGSGNEPSTTSEFTEIFCAIHYSYNARTLLSAGVTNVVSQGENIAYYGDGPGVPSNTASSNTTKRIFPIGKYIVGIDYLNYYSPSAVTATIDGNTISVIKTSGTYYGVGIAFSCVPGETYTISAVKNVASGSARICLSWYSSDGTRLTGYYTNASTYTKQAPSGAVQGLVVFTPSDQKVEATYTNIQIEVGSTATAYSAAFFNTYPIPAEIQALDGYGWSAGSVYNYIDFERKVFVQRVGSVDMSDLTFGYGPTVGWSATLPNAKDPADDDTVFNGVSDNYTAVSRNTQATAFSGGTDAGMVSVSGGKVYVGTGDISIVPSGTLYYELDTPVETDISEYLTDIDLKVEAGGTITFENVNGNAYRIPVPSEVEYIGK